MSAAPAIHTCVTPNADDWGVFLKVEPETLHEGDIVAISTHVVGRVVEVAQGSNRANLRVRINQALSATSTAGRLLDYGKRRGVKSVALIERDGVRVPQAPAGTRFDR